MTTTVNDMVAGIAPETNKGGSPPTGNPNGGRPSTPSAPKTSFLDVISSEANAVAHLQAQLDGTLEAYERKQALAEASSKLGRALTQAETNQAISLWESEKKLNAELEWKNELLSRTAAVTQALATPMDEYAAKVANILELLENRDVTGFTQEQFNAALATYNQELEQASSKTEEQLSVMTEFAVQAARNMETAMSGFFFDVMQGKFDGLGMSFKQTIDRMVSDLLASQVMGFLFGDFGKNGKTEVGGFVGKTLIPFMSNLGASIFGGARAYGGPVSPNSAYLVGERGPEMFVPNASGRIVPNGQLGSHVTVVQNINTPDVASFRRSQSQLATEAASAMSRAANRNL